MLTSFQKWDFTDMYKILESNDQQGCYTILSTYLTLRTITIGWCFLGNNLKTIMCVPLMTQWNYYENIGQLHHTVKLTVWRIFISAYLYGCFWRSLKVKVGMAISIWHLCLMSYSAFSGMFVDILPLFNHGSYSLIRFLRLIGENVVLRDKMSFLSSNYRVLY